MPIHSNIDVFFAIAEEAHAKMHVALAEHMTPHEDGRPGYLITWDPDRRSFKNAMIVIAFCGMFLDSFLYLLLLDRLGDEKSSKVDRLEHEKRLEALGITDAALLNRVAAFREARKDLMHEKAIELSSLAGTPIRKAQSTADSAIALMRDIRCLLVAA